MTLEQTRQLGIEFERRVQTMIPEKEILDKLDTETIYSYLNQYQDKYIHEIYRNLDRIESGSKYSAHVESILQSMLKSQEISIDDAYNYTEDGVVDPNGVTIVDTARSVVYKLDPQFYMYIRSVSQVGSTYSYRSGESSNSNKIRVIPNKLVSQSEVWKLIETPHDSLRILRYPAAVLGEYQGWETSESSLDEGIITEKHPTLTVIYDRYTTPLGIKILYYAQPQHFDLMTSVPCELPMDAFDDIVTGAVDLYVQYVAGAEARRRQQQEQAQRDARENQRNSRRNNNQDDES